MDNLVEEFLVESHENLDQLDRDLVSLEMAPSDPETLSRIFRTIHTLKGSCGFLGFGTLESVTHAGEDLLSLLRDGELHVNAEITTVLLSLVDAVRRILVDIETTGGEGEADYTRLIDTLKRLQQAEPPAQPLPQAKPQEQPAFDIEVFLLAGYECLDDLDRDLAALDIEAPDSEISARLPLTLETLEKAARAGGFSTLESLSRVGREPAAAEGKALLLELADTVRDILDTIEKTNHEGDSDYSSLIERLTAPPAPAAEPVPEAPAPARPEKPASAVADTSIRVDVALLNRLMDQVGELVLARNRILQVGANQEDRALLAVYQRLDLITAELQESVMKTRMQPIGTIWSKFPRVVRDLALEFGKKIELRVEGRETELDRTLIEAIRDPLTHLIRNAADHGIEAPAARAQAGKSETGVILLRAFHEGGQVNIEIYDDGAGIDPQRVAQRAVERGLIDARQAASMGRRDLLGLIFASGFSTAEKVSNISGRGVGMDVVKNNIEKINGSIDVQSEVGKSARIGIKIPLTLAIIPALIVQCAGNRYAIPQVSLIELVRLQGDSARDRIEIIHGAPVYRLRGNLLPLVFLRHELMIDEGGEDQNRQAINIVVLHADERRFGLVVDSVHDTEEIVVKPLSKPLRELAVYAGATIMGDGKVALILDVLGLAQRARVVSERREAARATASVQASDSRPEPQTLLLFEIASGERMALPLARVARLEKLSRSRVESSGRRWVAQYRERIMPLIDISQTLDAGGVRAVGDIGTGQDTLDVVVLDQGGRYVGLVVDKLLDIVEDRFEVQDLRGRPGVVGSVVAQGRVSELLALDEIIRLADPALFEQLNAAAEV